MTAETITETYSGQTTALWVANEATYGTDPNSGTWTGAGKYLGLMAPECTMTLRNNIQAVYGLGSRMQQQAVQTRLDLTGSITGAYQVSRFLAWAIGTDVKAGASPYTHTFATATVPPSASLPSFSMLLMRGTTTNASYYSSEIYTGCKINSVTFRGTLDAPLEVSLDIIAQNVNAYLTTAKGDPMAYAITDTVQPPQYGILTTSTVGTIGQVQSVDITINNNCVPVYGLGSRLCQQIVPTTFGMSIRATVTFNDANALNRFAEFTGDYSNPSTVSATGDVISKTLNLIYTNDGVGAAAATSRRINFDLSNVKWDELSIVSRSGSTITADLSGQLYGLTATGIVATDGTNLVYPL